jgi:hypothetical protein
LIAILRDAAEVAGGINNLVKLGETVANVLVGVLVPTMSSVMATIGITEVARCAARVAGSPKVIIGQAGEWKGPDPAKTHSPFAFGGLELPQRNISCLKASPGPYFDATMGQMGQ